jgi:hypothetical protein
MIPRLALKCLPQPNKPMKKVIVTTTINPPTEAVERFDAL